MEANRDWSAGARTFLDHYLEESRKALLGLPLEGILQLLEWLEEARRQGRQIFLCGNGGSAATASHFAAELNKESSAGRRVRFRALSLNDNLPWLTSLANDEGYQNIFLESLRNLARKGDLLLAFSTSGNSPNVVEAVRWARRQGLRTVALTGSPGGALADLAQLTLQVPSRHVGHVQEGHFLIQHLVAYYFAQAHPRS